MLYATLESAKALLKPLRGDSYFENTLPMLRNRFPHHDVLQRHLAALNIPELADRLLWFPYEEFRDIKPLGKGGFAAVFAGTVQTYEHRAVTYALKEIDPDSLAEVILMAILSSQINAAIVIYGLTQRPDGTYLMVSSILSFGNLESRLETMSEEQHTWDFVFEQALCICRNVRQFHDLGFVHNDLHPGNVLLDHPLSSTIVDFGLSRSLSYKSDDGVYGRLAYLPPEVFRAEPLTKESDVYCIGTLMWQLVSRVTPTGTAGKLREDGMREEFVPGMPPVYEGIIRDCWNIVPEKRPKIDELCQRMFDAFDECRPQYISGEPRNSGNQTASSSEFTPTNPTTVDNTTAAPRNPEDEHHKTTSHTLCTHDGSDTDSDDSIVIIDMDDTLHFQEPPRGMSNETRTYIAERMAAYRRDLAAENADGSNGSFDFAITSDAYVSGASVIDRSQFYSQKQLTELLADPVA